jgi:hypothetical protein
MRRILIVPSLCLVLAGWLGAQAIPGLKTYKTQEEYCADQPHAPTCTDGKPLKMLDLSKPVKLQPGSVLPQQQRMRVIQPPVAQPLAKPLNLAPDWRFAHPRAELLGGINVESLLQSPTLRELLGQLAGPLQIKTADIDSALAKAHGVKQVWISLRSGDALFLLQGKLNMPQGFIKLQNGMTYCSISDTAVLMGKQASVAAAVQRLKSPTPADPVVTSRMKNLSAENQLWLTATPALLKQAKPSPWTADLAGFSLGMQLRDGYRMEAILKCASLAAAHRVLASSQEHPPLPDASMKLDTRLEGSSVHFTLAIDKAHLLQVIDKAMAGPMGQRLKAMAVVAQKPGTMTSQGLPEGARQVQSSGAVVAAPAQPSTKLEGGITIQGGIQGGTKPASSLR